jgi:glucosamine--fructose-6-phosphate aminotransferase (isomerizing)
MVEALKRLEYRGYDSAGVATLENGRLTRRRAEGKLRNLDRLLARAPLNGQSGIGHTRWATHGRPSETNAHPHANGRVAVVHNGIIENFRQLRESLRASGHIFNTETDTEVVAHLVAEQMRGGNSAVEAVAAALPRLRGAFALGFLFDGEDDLLVGARRGSPLAVGWGEGEMFLGSDALALAPFTSDIAYLDEGDWVVLTRAGAEFHDASGAVVERPRIRVQTAALLVDKGEHRHFMAKEIHEQPDVVSRTLARYLDMSEGRVSLPFELPFDATSLARVTIAACGTAHYAGLVARYWFERFARLSVDIDVASEFRYREAPLPAGGLTVVVSQSGETADTLASLRYAKNVGQHVLSVVNVPTSTVARESEIVAPTLAGPEIGVASTKAFTCQLAVLACLAIALGRARGALSAEEEMRLVGELIDVPGRMAQALLLEKEIEQIVHRISRAGSALYLGRGASYPLALEGALKLKEISYIHAEGFAAGELKHGPIALIDEDTPVIVIAPKDSLLGKTASNVQEVAARGGRIIILVGDEEAKREIATDLAGSVLLKAMASNFAAIVYAIPVQLLAYHAAVVIGKDVDQPRNLAKSVTVE